MGTYVATLGVDDTYANDRGELTLIVTGKRVSWTVTGAPSPIVIEARQFKCSARNVRGKFPATMGIGTGSFTLARHGADFVFDASRVGTNDQSSVNYLGYVPNRAVLVRLAPKHQ